MFTSPSSTPFRLQITCDGVQSEGARQSISELTLRQLADHTRGIRLANVRVTRSKRNTVECRVQLFGRDLEQAGGYCDHTRLDVAVTSAVNRALCALQATERFDAWVSRPPASHRYRQ
jgi:hypothetical protein